jgi:membrane protease subunit HflK
MIYLPLDQLGKPRAGGSGVDSQDIRELESVSQQVQNEPLSGGDNGSGQRQSSGISREGR